MANKSSSGAGVAMDLEESRGEYAKMERVWLRPEPKEGWYVTLCRGVGDGLEALRLEVQVKWCKD